MIIIACKSKAGSMDTLKREEGTNAMNVELRKLGASIQPSSNLWGTTMPHERHIESRAEWRMWYQ